MTKFKTPPDIQHLNITEEERKLAMLMHRRGKGTMSGVAPDPGINSPDDISNLSLWYDVTNGIQETAGNLTQWDDLSGNGRPMDSMSANAPRYGDAQINGIDTVSIRATNQQWASTTFNFPQIGSIERTVIFIVRPITTSAANCLYSFGVDTPSNIQTMSQEWALRYNGAFMIFGGAVAGTHQCCLMQTIGPTVGDTIMFLNNIAQGVSTETNPTTVIDTEAGSFILGRNSAIGASYGDADVAEIIVYGKAISEEERNDLYNNYIIPKWGAIL